MNDYDINPGKVFDDSTTDNITKDTGIIDDLPTLSLNVRDSELVGNFKRWVSDAQAYWNNKKGYDLESRREKNERYYLGRQVDTSMLYQYQVPYQENQIMVGTEAIMAYVTGRNPGVEVQPDKDDLASRVMAENLEYALQVHSEKFILKQKVASAIRNNYKKYIGVIKLQYDPIVDDIVPRVVEPENLILDKDTKLGEEPRFICEVLHASVAQLIAKFPKAKSKIMRTLGRERMTSKLLGTVLAYNEIWFSQYNTDGTVDECVAWYIGDTILEKSKNPNFYYDGDGVQITNFIDRPTKPYVFFNYINDGSKLIDQTTPLEQVIPLQDILNKRGRQITENADTANAILVLRAGAIPDEEAENITRDPNQIITLTIPDDMPLASAYGEVQPHLLPSYVLNDKQDVKNAIHSILGTPSQFRGDDDRGEVGTLGEAQMVRSQSAGRQDAIIRATEVALDRYFRLLVQMMKVYYTSPKKFATRANDGSFAFVELSREKIPDVAWVRVEQGSMLREDKERRENVAMTLAKMGLIDPYNLYKDLGLKDADQRYEAWVKFKTDPMSLVDDVKSEIGDKTAYEDFAVIMAGLDAAPHDDVTGEHIEAHRKQMLTDRFLYSSQEIRDRFINHVQQEVNKIDLRLRYDIMGREGLLIDPNVAVQPEPMTKEQIQAMVAPNQQPPMGGMPPQGMPQGMPQGDPMMGGQPPVEQPMAPSPNQAMPPQPPTAVEQIMGMGM